MRILIISLLIVLASVLSSNVPQLSDIFIFDRGAILRGEIWRFFTCHFVHFSWRHLTYNLLAFCVAAYFFQKKQYSYFSILILCLAACIGTSLVILEPDMAFFGGLSGVVCGVIYYCALMGTSDTASWKRICWAVLLFLPIKIAVELFTNGSIMPYGEDQLFVPVQASHIMGCSVSVLFFLFKNNEKLNHGKKSHLTSETYRSPS